MDKLAINIQNLFFKYASSNEWVLKDINYKLNFGKFVLLTGPSGEGKSTLLSCINGIIPNIISGDLLGDIYINNCPIKELKVSEISHIVGSVLQNPESQIINSKIEDEIAFGCENINMKKEKIRKNLEKSCHLMQLKKEWATRTLSGGQKQRLMAAAILAMEQKILVFDEPLANLDVKGAQILLTTLRKLADEGYAIIMAEHRLELVLPFVDDIILLQNGFLKNYSDKTANINSCMKQNSLSLEEHDLKKPCFKVENLSYKVKETEILNNVTFNINKGERVVFIGDNGSGKTTLAKLMANILKPTKGKIYQYLFDSKNKTKSEIWFKKIGFIYQNPNYQLFMPSVYEEVNFMSKSKTLTSRILEQFKLTDIQERHPQSLSEGQKRKLTIACVLAMEPEVIFLDEPTVGQDYLGLQLILDILNDYCSSSETTLITITHEPNCAFQLADKVIWIEEGQIKEVGDKALIPEYFKSQKLAIKD